MTFLKLKAIFNIRNPMYVCVCKAVSDRDIKKLVNEGASSVEDVARCTGAGTQCGSCIPEIACLLEEKRAPVTISRRLLKVVPSSNAA